MGIGSFFRLGLATPLLLPIFGNFLFCRYAKFLLLWRLYIAPILALGRKIPYFLFVGESPFCLRVFLVHTGSGFLSLRSLMISLGG